LDNSIEINRRLD